MKNTFGNSLSVTLFGESHGEYIGAVLDGMTPGVAVDENYINSRLALRRPSGDISTSRAEPDNFIIASGVFEGKTTGTPLCILIPNTDTRSKDYSENRTKARPSHADFTAFAKYHGFEDYRGGGHFSGRVTAALVAAGAIAQTALLSKGITVATHIKQIGNVYDRDFENFTDDFEKLNSTYFAVLDQTAKEKMVEQIEKAKADCDSIGGVLETAVCGMMAGVGEPWFDSIESLLAHAVFSVPAVKGVEFGAGFNVANMRASVANDEFFIQNGKVCTRTNNSGGINGGITNGMPIIMRTAIKPTPTILKAQNTIDFINMQNTEITAKGRHDPCIVHRARAVIDAMCALTLCDLLLCRFGTDFFGAK